MKSLLDFGVTLIFLPGYCYTLTTAHVLLARVDKKINIPRHTNGEIRLKQITAWALPGLIDIEPDIKKAILMLRLNNYIAYAYMIFFIYIILF